MAHVDKKLKKEHDVTPVSTPPPPSTPPPSFTHSSTLLSSSALPDQVDGDEVREILQQSLNTFLGIKDQIESRLVHLERFNHFKVGTMLKRKRKKACSTVM
jgi:hypothetical protein